MKRFRFLLAATLLLVFAACSKDDEPATPTGEENIVSQFDPGFVAMLFLRGYIDDIYHITRADVEDIAVLDVTWAPLDWGEWRQLTSLKGIEYFTALERLNCFNNRLTALDVSRNAALKVLNCEYNPGRDGIFEVFLWQGSKWTSTPESWEYEGETVTVKYVGNEE